MNMKLAILLGCLLLAGCSSDTIENNEIPRSEPQAQKDFDNKLGEILADIESRKKGDSLIGNVAGVKIQDQVWMKYNLDVDCFINGDKII